MKVEYILVTPEMASNWLSNNSKNRPISKLHVNSYTTEMLSGNWKEQTGEAIKITKSNHVADGQHRLHAIIKANISLHFTVFTDMDDDIISVLDSGKRRNGSDVLSIYGIKNASLVSAIIAASNSLQNGFYGSSKGGSTIATRLTNNEILEEYQKAPEYWNEVVLSSKKWYEGCSRILTASTIGSLYVVFGSIENQKAISFLDQLCFGVPIHSNVINLLRNKIIQDATSNRKMNSSHRTNLIIKAWNYYRVGKDVKVLAYDSDKEGKVRPI
jgi:hypothetical protein